MEIVMIKKHGCGPCKMYEPRIKEVAKKNNLEFRTIQGEEMPEEIQPKYFPYFYLRKDNEVLEGWAGTNERKLKTVLNRHIPNLKL